MINFQSVFLFFFYLSPSLSLSLSFAVCKTWFRFYSYYNFCCCCFCCCVSQKFFGECFFDTRFHNILLVPRLNYVVCKMIFLWLLCVVFVNSFFLALIISSVYLLMYFFFVWSHISKTYYNHRFFVRFFFFGSVFS